MRRSRATTVGVFTAVVAAFAVLAGCSSAPAPRAWAAAVCDALGPWRTEIHNLTSRTQQQMTAMTTPAQAKENLVRLLGGAEQASETARSKVEQAGVPDVEQGEVVARGFVTSLTAVRDAYGRARTTIDALATTGAPETFYAGVRAAVDVLNKEYDESALDTSRLNSEELTQAFDEVPECR
ncbi:hypothetical protein [Polymorphospora sp. NPDC050346]|uniref:hypothetical protein n=1 Tax=Polymorphospora sp. NPDC050346 TaxID=3155780 RepID=UPI0033EF458F